MVDTSVQSDPLAAQEQIRLLLEELAQAQRRNLSGGVEVPPIPTTPRPLPSAGPRPFRDEPIRPGEAVIENIPTTVENIERLALGPSLFERVVGGVGKGIGEGFEKAFGSTPQPGQGKPLTTPGDVGMATMQTLAGTFNAILLGTARGLEGAGLSRTQSMKAARFLNALAESTIPLVLANPAPAVRSISAAERESARALRGLLAKKKSETLERMLLERREKRIKDRKLNLLAKKAAQEARDAARKGGKTGPEIEAAGIQADLQVIEGAKDLTEARIRDVLRAPDEILDKAPQVERIGLTADIQKRAVDLARQILIDRGMPANSFTPQRVQQLVMDLLTTDPQATLAFRLDLEAAGMDFTTFGRVFIGEGEASSAALNIRRAFFQEMRKETVFGKTVGSRKATKEFLDNMEVAVKKDPASITAQEASETVFQQLARIFKMSIVSPPDVAARNFLEANVRITISSLQRAVNTTLQRVLSPGTPRQPADPFGDLGRIFSANRRNLNAEQVRRIADGVPSVRMGIFERLEADFQTKVVKAKLAKGEHLSGLDKYEGLLFKFGLFFNRGQEEIVRTAVYGAELDRNLRRVGSSVDEMFEMGRFPAGFENASREAMLQALDITFALRAGGNRQLGRFFESYVGFISDSRVLPFFEPFPNFLFNATKFVLENVPTAGLRFTRPINRAKIATGDMSPIAREAVGTAMITLALAMRKGLVPGFEPGARYDEFLLKKKNRVSFAPFVSMVPFLFMAETAIAIEEGRAQASVLTAKEIRRALVGNSIQTQGMTSGLTAVAQSLANLMARGDPSAPLVESLGNIAGGFTRPVLPVRTLLPEIARLMEPVMPGFRELTKAFELKREIRGQGFLAPLKNIFTPGLLPERESPIRKATPRDARVGIGDTFSVGAPLISMATGAIVREPRTPFEAALFRNGFSAKQFSPNTGFPRLNALVSRFSGPVAELLGNELVVGPVFAKAGPKLRQFMLDQVLKISREVGLATADSLSPTGGLERRVRRVSTLKFNALVETLSKNLGPKGASPQEILDGIRQQVDVELKRQGL